MFRALLVLIFIVTPTLVVAAGEPLFDAATTGDTVAIEHLLATGAIVDARAPDQATPLITAALHGQEAVAKLLLSKGADVMARNSGGFTALHAAAYSGSAPIAALLLDSGAARDDNKNKAGTPPVFVAAEMDHPEVVEFLIAQGADVSQPEVHGYTAMSRAFWKGHKDMMRLLKRHGLTCQQDKLTADWYAQCLAITE